MSSLVALNCQDDITTFRLAHYVPLDEVDLAELTKIDIILSGLYHSENYINALDLELILKNELGCIINSSELSELLEQGYKLGYIAKVRGKYNLSDEIRSKLDEQFRVQQINQEKAIETWIERDISPFYNDLSEEIIKELKEKLVEFLTTFFLAHGAESVALITGGTQMEINFNINEAIESIDFKVPFSKEIAKEKFGAFLASDNSDAVSYLLVLANKAFKYLSTICDPQVLENLKKMMEGKTVYLDSSIVYRLLKLQGAFRYKVTSEVVSLCKEYGLVLKVTEATLKELERRIKFDSSVLREHPTPVNLSAVGYNYLTEENFISSYWELSKETGISIEDFIAKYSYIDRLIEAENIVIEPQTIETKGILEPRIKDILSKINLRDDHDKSPSAAEHDAYMIALIEYQRNGLTLDRFLSNKSWILTSDWFLIRFQRTDHEFKNKQPISILPSQLINILRFIEPRDNRFNEVFLEFFSKSFIPTTSKGSLSNESIQKVLARISQYKGYSPHLAKEILSDQLFTKKYSQSQTQGEQEELIHEFIVEKAQELENLVIEKVETINQLLNKSGELEDVIREKDEYLNTMSREVKVWQEQATTATIEIESLSMQVANFKRNIKRVLWIGGYIFISVLFLFIFTKIGHTQKLLRAIILTSITLGIIPVIKFSFDSKKANAIAMVISVVATVIALYYSIL
ncbi:MAG: hypothetical protein AB7E31_09585 [Desulfitobacterium sp.]